MSTKKQQLNRVLVPWVGEVEPEWLNQKVAGVEFLSLPLCAFSNRHSKQTEHDVFAEIASYEWAVFLDAPSVHAFFGAFFARFDDARCLGGLRIASQGSAAAEAVRTFRYAVDLEVEQSIAQALIETDSLDNAKILIISGEKGAEFMIKPLEEEGQAIVDYFPVYQKQWTALKTDRVAKDFRKHGAAAIVFPDAASVEAFMHQAGDLKIEPNALIPKSLSFDASTAEAMKKWGVPVDGGIEKGAIKKLLNCL